MYAYAVHLLGSHIWGNYSYIWGISVINTFVFKDITVIPKSESNLAKNSDKLRRTRYAFAITVISLGMTVRQGLPG